MSTRLDVVQDGVVSLSAYKALMEGATHSFARVALDEAPVGIAGTDLYREAQEMQRGIVDTYVPASELNVGLAYDGIANKLVPTLMVKGAAEYLFTGTAFSQICEKSGMGVTSYMKKCLSNGLGDLVPQNLNEWLRTQEDRPLLVRTHGNSAIAVLSDKYGVFDHGDALECFSTALDGQREYKLEAHSLSLDNMSVRLVDPEQVLLHDKSLGRDSTTAGILFRNGQTGQSYASLEFLLFTFACTNGLIVSQDRGIVYKRRHISIDRRDFTEQLVAALEQFPAYVEAARMDIERARNVRVDTVRREALRAQMRAGLGVGEETVTSIFEMMDNRWDANAWGLAGPSQK